MCVVCRFIIKNLPTDSTLGHTRTRTMPKANLVSRLIARRSRVTEPRGTDEPIKARRKTGRKRKRAAGGSGDGGNSVPRTRPKTKDKPSGQSAPRERSPPTARSSKVSKLQQAMRERLKGSEFRWLNEKLYTCRGSEAFDYFQKHPNSLQRYHEGFKKQAKDWPTNPLDDIIRLVRKRCPRNWVVGDFGCGEARLAASVPHRVHSFDLVRVNERVTPCDMAKVPLPAGALDAAVFCLSLMGTNTDDFLTEARRCLRAGGALHIAEVVSRMSEGGVLNDAPFIARVESLGFSIKSRRVLHKMFVFFEFKKAVGAKTDAKAPRLGKKTKKNKGKQSKKGSSTTRTGKSKQNPKSDTQSRLSSGLLAPCMYKRR